MQENETKETNELESTPAPEQVYFSVCTRMNSDTMHDYYRFHLRWRSRIFNVTTKFLGILLAFSALAGPFYRASGVDVSVTRLMLLLLEGFVLFFADVLLAKMNTMIYQKNQTADSALLRMDFREIRMRWENGQNTGYLYYGQFPAAYETKGYFYLYLNKRTAYIVSKAGFSTEEIDGLRTFLNKRLDRSMQWRGSRR